MAQGSYDLAKLAPIGPLTAWLDHHVRQRVAQAEAGILSKETGR